MRAIAFGLIFVGMTVAFIRDLEEQSVGVGLWAMGAPLLATLVCIIGGW